MPTITALTSQKKRKDRINVFVDGKFDFGIGADNLVKFGLFVGKQLTPEGLDEVKESIIFCKNYEKVLNFLSFRPRSEWEVRQYLYGKDVDADAVIKRLHTAHYLNDLDFALWLIGQRRGSSKPRGDYKIHQELLQKGVGEGIVKKAFAKLCGDASVNELQRAKKAAQKKLKKYDTATTEGKRKMQAYLLRQGFEWEVVLVILNSVCPENTY